LQVLQVRDFLCALLVGWDTDLTDLTDLHGFFFFFRAPGLCDRLSTLAGSPGHEKIRPYPFNPLDPCPITSHHSRNPYFCKMNNLRITTVQSTLHWENVEANLEAFDLKIRTLESTDIIILPETFTTGFSMNAEQIAQPMDGLTMQWLSKQAATHQAVPRILLRPQCRLKENSSASSSANSNTDRKPALAGKFELEFELALALKRIPNLESKIRDFPERVNRGSRLRKKTVLSEVEVSVLIRSIR